MANDTGDNTSSNSTDDSDQERITSSPRPVTMRMWHQARKIDKGGQRHLMMTKNTIIVKGREAEDTGSYGTWAETAPKVALGVSTPVHKKVKRRKEDKQFLRQEE